MVGRTVGRRFLYHSPPSIYSVFIYIYICAERCVECNAAAMLLTIYTTQYCGENSYLLCTGLAPSVDVHYHMAGLQFMRSCVQRPLLPWPSVLCYLVYIYIYIVWNIYGRILKHKVGLPYSNYNLFFLCSLIHTMPLDTPVLGSFTFHVSRAKIFFTKIATRPQTHMYLYYIHIYYYI